MLSTAANKNENEKKTRKKTTKTSLQIKPVFQVYSRISEMAAVWKRPRPCFESSKEGRPRQQGHFAWKCGRASSQSLRLGQRGVGGEEQHSQLLARLQDPKPEKAHHRHVLRLVMLLWGNQLISHCGIHCDKWITVKLTLNKCKAYLIVGNKVCLSVNIAYWNCMQSPPMYIGHIFTGPGDSFMSMLPRVRFCSNMETTNP